MSRRALLAILAALALLAAIVAVGPRLGGPPSAGSDAPFLPELAPALADLTGVVITGPGNQVIATLARDGDRWVVREADGYPADVGKLRQNLQALAAAKRLEEKTSAPELYGRLGVSDPAESGSRAIRLDFQGPTPVPAVLLGDTGVNGADAAYARRVGEAASWLISGRYEPGKLRGDWLDRSVVDLPAAKVRKVTITQPDRAVLTLTKDSEAATEFTVADLPKGRQLAYDGVADAIGGALAALTFDGVDRRAILGDNPPKPVVARFETFDGLTVETSAWRLPMGTRYTLVASTAADNAAAKAAADAINARVGGWVYTLPDFKAELLTRRREDLLQP
jgi:hypothetical protein